MKIKALIVDDLKDQQEILSKKIAEFCPQIELLGIASSVEEGISRIKELKPQLIFLDVMMPPLTGFDLLTSLQPIDFEVIFVTSYTDFAFKAFKVAAVDYIHKPFSNEDLKTAVTRAEEKIRLKAPSYIHHLLNNIHNNTADNVKIGLPTLTGYVYVHIKDIIHIEGANEYTRFYFSDKRVELVSKKMGEMEEMLQDYNFYRTHLSHIINLRYVKEYLRGEGGQARLTDGTLINISRKNKEGFLLAMKSI